MRSLRWRIAASFAALIVVAMALLAVLLLRAENDRLRASLQSQLESQALLISDSLAPLLQRGVGSDVVDSVTKRFGTEARSRVTIIAPDGTVLADSENDPHRLENYARRPEVLQALAQGAGRSTRHSPTEGRDATYYALRLRADGRLLAVVRVSRPLSDVNAVSKRILLSMAVAVILMTLGAAALGVLIAGSVTRPLRRLRAAAHAVAFGSFDVRAAETGGGAEVADVSAAFNEMAERVQRTLTLEAEERSRLQALLGAATDAVVAVDARGRIRYLNRAAEHLVGAAVGRTLAEVARNHELSERVAAALSLDDTDGSGAVHFPQLDRWLDVTAAPIVGGGDWALLVHLRDVTDAQRADRTRRDFAANVSHELRTPLAGIKAVVETLRDGALDDPPAAAQFLDMVDNEVDRLVQLVEELLQLSRIESGAGLIFTEIDPQRVLAACLQRFAHQAERAGVSLTLAVEQPLPLMQADADRLGQALGNLVHNALKFTAPGGCVALSARTTAEELQITVADNGSGIDPAELPRIFERFYVADRARVARGTGLGLAIVKHIARAHGGSVEATSILGRGSTFTITLPLRQFSVRR